MAETRYAPVLIYRFGHFEVMPEAGELYRRGQRVRIQELPFRVLVTLLEQHGQIVPRDVLAKQLWPQDVFVEFDQGLSTAVAKLRQALGDVADNPRFIETVPRRGYRFIAPVMQESPALSAPAKPELQSLTPPPHEELSVATTAEQSIIPEPRVGRRFSDHLRWFAAAALLLLAGGALFLLRPSKVQTPLRANDQILLTDFDNTTGNVVFTETLLSALRIKLEESPYFALTSAKATQAALEQGGVQGTGRVSLQDAQRICGTLHAKAIVHGTVAPIRDGLRVQLQAELCNGGALVQEEAFSPSTNALLLTLGDTADRLRRDLGEPESSVKRFGTPILQATTSSLPALQAFASGEQKRARGQDHETIADYKLATDLDPEFALAYARLGTVYGNENETELSRAVYQKAFDLRLHTTERERLYLTAHYYSSALGDAERAEEVYNLWRQLYPEDLIAPNNLADLYETLGEPELARAMAREAVRIAPNNAFPYAGLLQADQRLGLYEEARSVWHDASVKKLDDSIISRMAMFRVGVAQGDAALIQQQEEWAAGNPRQAEMLMLEGWVCVAEGRLRAAQTLFHRAQEVALNNGLKESAADAGLELAQFEADIGQIQEARTEVGHSLRLAPDVLNVKAFAAMVLAVAGEPTQASTLAEAVRSAAPQNTIFVKMILPITESRLSRVSRHPEAAVDQLRPVQTFDRSRVIELVSIYDRAQALLSAGRGLEAEKEFARLEQLRSLCPISPYIPLAHLGMARGWRLIGDLKQSRGEYATFLQRWRGGDVDLPLLRRVQAEYQSLGVAAPSN
ncbi:winged helix-turn-helix domain-containing protein [Terriglobus aquaticus]|uniref:Winged helix-turn-helix domain-containing protein n=1 Tax=Terriglobus aquaticus TaxID=940139 RepID=A0ABW9KN93_9BACT|nr:winged helix-turn-helix domain-containing protein [Terriglobus aquaticus]